MRYSLHALGCLRFRLCLVGLASLSAFSRPTWAQESQSEKPVEAAIQPRTQDWPDSAPASKASGLSTQIDGKDCQCTAQDVASSYSCVCHSAAAFGESPIAAGSTPSAKPAEAAAVADHSVAPTRVVRVGVSAAVGLPHLWTESLDFLAYDRVGLSLGYGHAETREFRDYKVGSTNEEAVLKFFPTQKSFYVGLAVGRQQLSIDERTALASSAGTGAQEAAFSYRLSSRYVTPQIGWFWRMSSGLVLGFDMGYQKTIGAPPAQITASEAPTAGPGGSTGAAASDYQKKKEAATRQAQTLSRNGVPYLEILRLGWMF